MKKDDVLKALKEDEEDGNGEIIDKGKHHSVYYDYNEGIETHFRYEEGCTDRYVADLIHIGSGAAAKGLKKQFLIDVLKKAYGEDYYDAICTCAGIIIPSNGKEFIQMLSATFRNSDDVNEWYQYCEQENVVGRMFRTHQIVFINEAEIAKLAKTLGDEIISEEEEYETGIITTLIHEIRHLMLDTNPFLPEDEFPVSEASEDAVEAFCRQRYTQLGDLRRFK